MSKSSWFVVFVVPPCTASLVCLQICRLDLKIVLSARFQNARLASQPQSCELGLGEPDFRAPIGL